MVEATAAPAAAAAGATDQVLDVALSSRGRNYRIHRKNVEYLCMQLMIFFTNHLFGTKMMEEDDDIAGPLPIEKLSEAGINASDIKKLKAQGMFTVESVCFTKVSKIAHPYSNFLAPLARLLLVPSNFSVIFVGSVTQKLKKCKKLQQNSSQWASRRYPCK